MSIEQVARPLVYAQRTKICKNVHLSMLKELRFARMSNHSLLRPLGAIAIFILCLMA